MNVSRTKLALVGFGALAALSVASPAFAQTTGGGMFADIQSRYAASARGWSTAMTSAATFLFMGLAAISLVWTMGLMALRRADLGEFFSEFIRFVVFTGFYLFLLTNGPAIADAIIRSLQQLGSNAAGIGNVTPGSIVDIGFDIVNQTVDQSSIWEPVDSAVGIIIACIILVVLALVAVNMLLLLVSAWILAYGGIFFLGFGGSRWTSDMAINYYKTVLGVAASLMGMVLLVGIGKSFIDDYHSSMAATTTIKDLAGMMVACVILLVLVNKIPGLIAGIITGASVGGAANVSTLGAGAAMTAGGMAAAAAATGGAALAGGAANAAGGASAISAAFKSAQENMASGGGMFSGSGSGGGSSMLASAGGGLGPDGGGGGGGGSGGGGGGGGASPLSSAMGGSGGTAEGHSFANDNANGGSGAATGEGAGAETATSGVGSPAGTPGGTPARVTGT